MGNTVNTGDFAFDESPRLRVVDLPRDLGLKEPPDAFLRKLRNKEQGQFNKRATKIYKGKKPSSKYKGVVWHKTHNYWQIQIQYYGKRYYLSNCEDEKEAALAYDKAATQLFGEYARTNQMMFPEDFE